MDTWSISQTKRWTRLFYWLVVGPPLWKIWVRQLGWWQQPNINGKIKLMFQTTNQFMCSSMIIWHCTQILRNIMKSNVFHRTSWHIREPSDFFGLPHIRQSHWNPFKRTESTVGVRSSNDGSELKNVQWDWPWTLHFLNHLLPIPTEHQQHIRLHMGDVLLQCCNVSIPWDTNTIKYCIDPASMLLETPQ